jgi:hypothetical protein
MLSAGGLSLDRLAEKFQVNRYAVHRHMARHVDPETLASYLIGPAALADLALVAAQEQGSVLDHLKVLRSTLFNFLDKAARAGDTAAVTSLSTAILRVLRQLGTASGEITQAASAIITVNNSTTILTSPPFIELQHGLIEVCRAHPEARDAIVALCARLDKKYSPAPPAGPPAALPSMIDVTPHNGGAHV